MNITRIFFIAVALLLSYVSAQAQELRRILYGVSTSIAHLPVWVGKDAGLFAKNGLNIEPVQIRGGAVSTMAIMSGQAVLSGVGAGSVVAARVEGGDIVLLACPTDLEPVYLIARPEIKSAADLKGKAAGVTRLNSSIHFYLRSALRMVGVDSDKEMTLLQLGGSAEITSALEAGRISAVALTIKDVLPFMQRGWPVLVDLTKSDLVYPSKWLKEKESPTLTKSVEAFVRLFKPVPYVPDKGIENILKDLALQRPVPKDFIGHPELFRDHGPLERALPKS